MNHGNALGTARSGGYSNLITVRNGILDLNGFSNSIGGLTDGDVATGTISNNSEAASMLTIGSSSTNTAFSGTVQDGLAAVGITKTGSAMLTLAGTNTYTGTTAVNAGTLKVTGSIGDSVVTVNNAGTVLASGATGTIGKGVTVNSGAILAAGGTNAVGTATVGSAGLSFANGSIFEWDLATSKDADGVGIDDGLGGTDFDSLSVAGPLGAATTGANFKLIFGTGALADVTNTGNAFWNTPYGTQQWNMSAIFGKAFDTNAFSSVQTSTDVSAYGSFTITGSTLTWTAVPEPRTAFVGLLLAGGLLRRRRS